MNYQNNREVSLMVWETNPRMRNKNNIIKVNSKVNLEIGDSIIGGKNEFQQNSTYTIEEIINKRPSSISNMDYYTLKTTHKFK